MRRHGTIPGRSGTTAFFFLVKNELADGEAFMGPAVWSVCIHTDGRDKEY